MKEFFSEQYNKEVIVKFKNNLELRAQSQSEFEVSRNRVIKLILNAMSAQPAEWDKSCQINIEWIGIYLINKLSDTASEVNKELLDDICSCLFRFLFELYLSINADLSIEFEGARKFVIENVSQFEESSRSQIEFAVKQMPISIFKSVANGDAISNIKELNSIYASSEKIKTDWDNDFKEKEGKVKALKESLDKYHNAFNFVGLYQGFDELSKEKHEEKEKTLFWLKALAILVFIPIVAEFIVVILNFNSIDNVKSALLISFLPVFSMVTIVIYYFRILLVNYKSVKAQLLQIELRKTLCRFIQHYSEYSAQMKKQDPESLAKFENIIFSGLVSNDANLPSSYDGVEQIANLIKSIKS